METIKDIGDIICVSGHREDGCREDVEEDMTGASPVTTILGTAWLCHAMGVV